MFASIQREENIGNLDLILLYSEAGRRIFTRKKKESSLTDSHALLFDSPHPFDLFFLTLYLLSLQSNWVLL